VVSLGLTDHITVTVGSAFPFWLMDRQAINVMGGLKVGGSLSEHFAGVPLSVSRAGWEGPRFFVGTLGGSLRLTNRLAAVTEHWVLFGYMAEPTMLNSLGLRILGERWGVDLGAVRVPNVAIPIPWVNFSWHWG
jgi:hypothetical protein